VGKSQGSVPAATPDETSVETSEEYVLDGPPPPSGSVSSAAKSSDLANTSSEDDLFAKEYVSDNPADETYDPADETYDPANETTERAGDKDELEVKEFTFREASSCPLASTYL
jgi:hypothetical protein